MRMDSILPGAGRTRSSVGVLGWSPKSFWTMRGTDPVPRPPVSRHLCGFYFFRAKAEVLDFDHVLRVYGIISEKFLSFMSKGFRL